MSEELVEIKIPKRVYEKLKQEVEASGEFKSVDEYVTFILEKFLEEETEEESVYSEEEEREIRERLKSLGYI